MRALWPIDGAVSQNEEERMNATTTRLYRAREVARLLGVHPSRVRELAASGELPSVRLGAQGWHRFRPEDVERLIAGENRRP
jgi:excisionase family DNA binding protein